jgi:phosphonate transport system substrate-binding protein
MKLTSLPGLFLAATLCLAAGGVSAATCDNPPRLRFSLIPQGDLKKDAAAFESLLTALEMELGKPIEVILPSSYASVVEGLLAASVDLAMMGPASYATAKNSDSEVQAFATYSTKAGAYQDEGNYYRSLLVVRSDSKFRDSESLRGATLALVDPVSTSGAVVPRHLYSPHINTSLEKYFGRIVYTGGHDKSASALGSGKVNAAFISSFLLSEFISSGKAKKEDYKILWQSEPIPLDPFVYRGRLCAPIKEKIRKVFLAKQGQAYPEVLEKLNAVRFSAVNDDSYKTIREILRASSN